MEDLKIDDNLKLGKQELLLDPTKEANKCGAKVTALTLNDLMYKKDNGTYISAVDLILQENISIDNIQVAVSGANVVVTWVGDNKVLFGFDGEPVLEYPDTTKNELVRALPAGVHTVFIKSLRDRRGITETFTITGSEAGGLEIIYGEQ